ncbi:ABC transporter ATP-binding protein [Gulosibacter sp. 10]|uniref:ABC transporter ATP-binding protein n=1 Tax=Gulosibacter sp. 10 TaxID=1255570 RepID=UPI00097F693E|nr:energy-coupling factor transporter ATPase [Gulosibacter sp. 10]SJM64307.1 ATPase component NikO of energizing module of nickel ECF transporter [Gulosibacter sp. 10]
MTNPALIRVESLSVTHRDAERPTPAEVSFEVRPGEALLVLGPSGCGKSTLSLSLNGLVPKAMWAEVDGSVALSGRPLADLELAEASRHAAMVFQDPDAQIVAATVFDEVAFGPENLCVPAEEIDARVERALRDVGLWERREDAPELLSGGGRQRLSIAAALAQGSPLVILDEPTANLDPHGAREVYRVLDRLLEERRIGVVLIEHNLDEALRIATRALVLDADGAPFLTGTPREVFVEHAEELSALGVWLPIATAAGARLRSAGWAFRELPLTVAELREALLAAPAPGASPGSGAACDPADAAADEPAASTADTAATSTPGASEGLTGPATFAADTCTAAPASPATDAPSVPDGLTVSSASAPPAAALAGSPYSAARSTIPTTASADPVLRAEGLTVRRGRRTVLDGVSLDVPRGAFVAVVGPNGAGKSTLLQSLAGIETPPRGAVTVFDPDYAGAPPTGRDVARLGVRDLRDRIGYVFQNPEHQFLANTVREELSLEPRARRLDEPLVTGRVAAALARFGLERVADLHPFLLSGGQKRRLSVATALMSEAPVLVLDEPTFGQDQARAVELVDMLRQLNDAGTTVLMATHDLQLAAEVADRLIVVDAGRIAAHGPTPEVLAGPVLEEVGIGLPPLATAFRRLDSQPRLSGITRMRDLPGPAVGRGPGAAAFGGHLGAAPDAPGAATPGSGAGDRRG